MSNEPARRRPSGALDWDRDGADWPHRAASRFVEAAGLRWHVQQMGTGPAILLVHGTGAATHSWRDLMPILADTYTVVAPDLPGHGFTETAASAGMSLEGMSRGVTKLMEVLQVRPELAVGHSAGAAVIAQMSLESVSLKGLVSLNGAFQPIGGSRIFSPLAKLIAGNSVVPRLFAWRVGDGRTFDRLIRATGSQLDATGKTLYARLARNPVHVAGALAMMANWDLPALQTRLPRTKIPLLLVAAGDDGTVPATDAFKTRAVVPGSTVEYIRGLGHLAHEERPREIAGVIDKFARDVARI